MSNQRTPRAMETNDDRAGQRSPSGRGYKRSADGADPRVDRRDRLQYVIDRRGAPAMSATRLARAEDSGTAIALALERERRRVADELHDTAIQLVLARILIERTREQGAADELDGVRRLLDDALEQLRSLVLGLTPTVLSLDGLCPAIEWLCGQLGTRWRLQCRCRVVGDPAPLPSAISETLFQGARELMTNVGRHAQARTCDVVLRYGGDRVELSVRDDGIGIDPRHTVGAPSGGNGGFGPFSLRAQQGAGGANYSSSMTRRRSRGGPANAAARKSALPDWYASLDSR